MAATNHTANYNLPQFIGTDKPAWLTDVNGAMTAIDTQMKANADAADAAGDDADSALEKIGDLTTLTTTAKTTLVAAVNEVNAATPVITMTSVDPGEGVSLAANNFIAVYEA